MLLSSEIFGSSPPIQSWQVSALCDMFAGRILNIVEGYSIVSSEVMNKKTKIKLPIEMNQLIISKWVLI